MSPIEKKNQVFYGYFSFLLAHLWSVFTFVKVFLAFFGCSFAYLYTTEEIFSKSIKKVNIKHVA